MIETTDWNAVQKAIRVIKSCSTHRQLFVATRFYWLVINRCVTNASYPDVREKFKLESEIQCGIIDGRLGHVTTETV